MLIAAWRGNLNGVKTILKLVKLLNKKDTEKKLLILTHSSLSTPLINSSNSNKFLTSTSFSSSPSNSHSLLESSNAIESITSVELLKEDTDIDKKFTRTSGGNESQNDCHNDNNNNDNDTFKSHNNNFKLDFNIKGVGSHSSVCGGKGPYNAAEWAQRKSVVCPENTNFKAIFKLLTLESEIQKSYGNKEK